MKPVPETVFTSAELRTADLHIRPSNVPGPGFSTQILAMTTIETRAFFPGIEMNIRRCVVAYQTVFKRYELKYILNEEQHARILRAMAPHMERDKFGQSTIRNIYFDTDDYILARHSIAKPDFKEKLRIRSYAQAGSSDTVFVELKRKYDRVVYKRRVALPESQAMRWTTGGGSNSGTTQMTSEIDYFLDYYKNLRPMLFLSYDREAYRMKAGADALTEGTDDFRVTFDTNILCRDFDLSLGSAVYGTPIMEPGKILMELKCSGGIPLWMVQVLSEEKVYKTSFSKYGTAYTDLILPELRERQTVQHRERSYAETPSFRSASSYRERHAAQPAGRRKLSFYLTHRTA